MRFTSEHTLEGGILERELTLGEAPGILWIPGSLTPPAPAPLILLGHPGGLGTMYPPLSARARHAAELGFATATLELPGSGERPRIETVEQARADLRRAIRVGERPADDVVDRLVLPLVERAVQELREMLDQLLALPGITGPVGLSAGIIALGVRLARLEPRIAAAGLFADSFVPGVILEEAGEVSVPLHVLLQWDDRGNDRRRALDLFDAFGSEEKTLLANMGGHTGVPPHAAEDAGRSFLRHLR